MSPETIKKASPADTTGNIDPGLSKATDPMTVLAEQAEQLHAAVPMETISDQYDFQRVKFSLGDTDYVFRGREELPVLSEQTDGINREVLTTDEVPVYTDKNEFITWIKGQEEGSGEVEADSTEFIASDTPRGIIDAALKIIETGHGEKEGEGRLKALRKKLEDDETDDEVLGLFDVIYTAGAVDLETGKTDGYGASPEAPMLAALALSGNELAQTIINTKRKIVDGEDEKKLFNRDREQLKRPGEPLSDAELEIMKNAHFIAVHTTPTLPKRINEHGDLGIFPSGEYELGEQTHYPRETIHWSLNHAVDSHMMGDFKGRRITIVDPLDELTRTNGAPNVLFGVDTYFSANPGQPLVLSREASIVQLKDGGLEQPIIARDGNNIHLTNRGLQSEDFSTLEAFFGYSEVDQKHGIEGMGKYQLAYDLFANGGIHLNRQMVERIENGEQDSAYEFLTEDQKAESARYMRPFESAYALIQSELPENPNESDYSQALEKLFEKIVKGEVDIAEHPEFHEEIIETVRIMAVNKLIEEKGGKVEKAGGQSQYMADEDFKAKERLVVSSLGLKSGLHDNNLESFVEGTYSNSRSKATSGNYEEGTLKFDWSKYDDSDIWMAMGGSSWQNRRHLVRSGMLSFTPKKAQKAGASFFSAPADAF